MKVNWTYFSLKTSILVLLLAAFPLKLSLPLCLFVTWSYQYLVALLNGVHVMPTMDTLCLAGDSTAVANMMSIFLFEITPKE